MDNNFALIYVGTGRKCFEQAFESAKTARKFMPNIFIYLFTDIDQTPLNTFDEIIKIENPYHSVADKVHLLSSFGCSLDHSKLLYLDTDTRFIGSVYEISQLLDQFQFAYVNAPFRVERWEENNKEIPHCFSQPNTGVLAFQSCNEITKLLGDWKSVYLNQKLSKNPPPHDQPALRYALYYSNVKFTILPPEYNMRTPFPCIKGGNSYAKILHGDKEYNDIAELKIKNDYKNRIVIE